MKTNENFSLVYLEWLDSASSQGWSSIEDYKPDGIFCKSVGWIIRETEDLITIASNIGAPTLDKSVDQACGWMTIPKAVIRARRILNIGTIL